MWHSQQLPKCIRALLWYIWWATFPFSYSFLIMYHVALFVVASVCGTSGYNPFIYSIIYFENQNVLSVFYTPGGFKSPISGMSRLSTVRLGRIVTIFNCLCSCARNPVSSSYS